jgi:hypothetical protein
MLRVGECTGALDLVRGRYLLMYESLQIGYYNLSTLAQTNVIQLPVQQLPEAMHYDAVRALLRNRSPQLTVW